MIPKKIYIRKIDIDIFDNEVNLTRAWVANKPCTGRREYTDLSQIWHDVSEEPKLKVWFIAQIGENAFDTFVMEIDKNDSWVKWSKGLNIIRWAYIEDLLPKGGIK